jgi:hypothetical protein
MIGNETLDPGLTRRDRHNLKPLKFHAAIWLVSFLYAHLVLPRGDGSLAAQPLWVWPVLAAPIVAGVLLAYAYLRFIQGADELMRKIHAEALAFGFGVAFVFGMGADLLGQVGLDDAAEVTWAVMIAAYALRLRFSRRAYSE